MRRSRMIYLPDSGVEPGRDGRYDDMRQMRYDEDYTPRYERERIYREPNRIGFDRDPYARRGGMRMTGGRSRADYDRGYGGYDNGGGLSWEDAKDWMMHIRNGDGRIGPHWSIDQTNKLLEKKQLDCEAHEFWAAMNMLYSDYGDAAKKFGVDNADFFACMAEAFLDDDDAVEDKLAVYYDCIVEH